MHSISQGQLNFGCSYDSLLATDDPWLALHPRCDHAILAAEALHLHTTITSWWIHLAHNVSLWASFFSAQSTNSLVTAAEALGVLAADNVSKYFATSTDVTDAL